MERVLVTGGAGFIGSHVVDLLVGRGYEVRVLDSLEPPTHGPDSPRYLPEGVEFVRGDVRDAEALERTLRGVQLVVHLAATGGFTPRIAEYVDSNSVGTARLLEAVGGSEVRKLVVASSVAVYGEGAYRCEEHGQVDPGLRSTQQLAEGAWEPSCPACGRTLTALPTPESKPVDPATPYAISKYDQERLVLSYSRQTGLPAAALRYFVTYGPRQSPTNPYTGVASIFSTRIRHGLPLVIYEDGLQTRDFVFVEDIARATVFALETDEANSVFNVCTGRATRLGELAELLQQAWGREVEVELGGRFRFGDVRHIVGDPSSLAALGFRAERTLADGLGELVEWLATQPVPPDRLDAAMAELRDAQIVRETP